MAKDHRWAIAHLQSQLSGVLFRSQPIRSECVPESVVLPFDFSFLGELTQAYVQLDLANNGADTPAVGLEKFHQW